MDNLDFSEEEIQEQLAVLGYKNIPKHRLLEFKQDLDDLIRHGDWSLAASTQLNTKTLTTTSRPSPPAYTKEKVSQCYSDGFFLHADKAEHDREVKGYGRQQRRCDSYAQHSVAPKLQLPPGAPRRLQVEPDVSLHSRLSDSSSSSSDTEERRFIKRKVLRKHEGQSLVCDESIYSEDSGVHFTTMYKMYNPQLDEESDDGRNSLSSSFWSDGEKQEEEEEEEVEMERAVDSRVDCAAEDSLQEEKPELNNHRDRDRDRDRDFTAESSEDGSNDGKEEEDDDDGGGDDGDEESCSSSPDSPAASLMTSGYGTYRPEEQEGGEYRDDHTVTEFDQDSRGDLSETRDDEEDEEEDGRSRCSFGEFGVEPPHEPDFNETPADVLEDEQLVSDEEKSEEHLHTASENEETNAAIQIKTPDALETKEDKFLLDENGSEDRRDVEEELEPEEEQDEVPLLNKAEDDVDESSSNKDIKFIDSRADLNWSMYRKMCEEWEGNLRHRTDATSRLEERLAELHVSTSAQRDLSSESEDRTDLSDTQSSESDGIPLSAFESYIRGMTRTRSEGDLRPRSKSFIRPVVSRQTIKKTDPVAKYFQYKQLWDMFKLPGEKDRRALRWEIKERLAYQPPPPKPRRVYVPNTYVVPTEKKRSALRWEVRNDVANGLLPHKYNYRF